jgi:hypothetical protein
MHGKPPTREQKMNNDATPAGADRQVDFPDNATPSPRAYTGRFPPGGPQNIDDLLTELRRRLGVALDEIGDLTGDHPGRIFTRVTAEATRRELVEKLDLL